MNSPLPQGLCSRSGALLAAAVLLATASPAAAANAMYTGGTTSPPIGHFEFCRTHVSECKIRSRDTRPEPMTNKIWRQIVSINQSVNQQIRPLGDFDHFGKDEVWNYPTDGFGDCEDYVLEKRRRLLQGGVPISDLLITVVLREDDSGHAVLTVRTDKGDFILDSLNPQVLRWDRTRYRYVKRQAIDYTGHWVSILDDTEMTVGALK
jgi:predicted transglutaminase-like cysteine proteinase